MAPAPAFPAFIAFAPAFIALAFATIGLAFCAEDAGEGDDGRMMFADDAVCVSFNGAEELSAPLRGEVTGEEDRRLLAEEEGEDKIGRGMAEAETERGLGLAGEEAREGGARVGEARLLREGLFLRLGTEGEEWRVLLIVGREPAE